MKNRDKSSDFSATVVSMINAAAVIGHPVAAPILSAISPILQRILERGFSIFHRESTVTVECARLGIAYVNVVNTINRHIEQGEDLRDDGFFDAINDSMYTKADEIIEATLKNVVFDAETQKSEIYGKFIGSIPFLKGYSVSQLISLNSILRQLTIEDIENLRLFIDLMPHDFSGVEINFKNVGTSDLAHMYTSLLHLKNMGLIIRSAPFVLGMDIGTVKASLIGKELLDIICS